MPTPEEHSPPPPGDSPADTGLPEVSPDIVEQEHGDELDNIIPTEGYGKTPVVGLGGSAGGLVALQGFFAAMPPDSGMAFVVIMHLAPEHESILDQLLQRVTAMPVTQVQTRVKIEPNQVYVIPPAKHLSMSDGSLVLTDSHRQTGRHIAVDLFFRTLADTQGPHAAAIVLSGADGDGATGIKRVKERGGLTITQNPDEAQHDSMPRTAISTGMVDWVMPVAEIPTRLVEYWRAEQRLLLPPVLADQPSEDKPAASDRDKLRAKVEIILHDILGALRVRTGHDFTYYRRPTVLRRIARRMQVHGIDDPRAYLNFLRSHPDEPGLLLRDLLISVTNFFRDREAFAALEDHIPTLFHHKGPDDSVRVWVPACATGEEAYSVAMLLHEHAAKLAHPPSLQVFATDLDEHAIRNAREGVYLDTITADVSEGRLRRFFTKEHAGYRVTRELRETVLFALHDLLKDSPFSRLDAVTCRNLLIYLNRDAQARALDIFYFGLRPDGLLFLGSSESADEDSQLFAPLDKKRRLFARGVAVRAVPPIFSEHSTLLRAVMHQTAYAKPGPAPEPPRLPELPTVPPPRLGNGDRRAWSDLHYEFIERLAPPSVLVDKEYRIVHLSEQAGRFLQLQGGEASMDLLHLVHPALRTELRATLFRADESGETVESHGLTFELAGLRKTVRLRVLPARSAGKQFLLVVFDEVTAPAASAAPTGPPAEDAEPVIRQLEQELERVKWQLRQVSEQSDASNEELKAANEEFQAMNEELRSATEELETGREELQSVNEELNTVNQELKGKLDDLGRVNGDLQNLMAATQIATIFLDRQLHILRYTPPAVALFNLIPTDVNRPLSDLTTRLIYPDLTTDAARVLDDLTLAELEVPHADGRHFLTRLRPYRTTDDRISGVVLTFVDITARKEMEIALRSSEEHIRSFVAVTSDTIYKMNVDWTQMYQLQGKEFLADTHDPSRTWLETYIPPDEQPKVLAAIWDAVRHKRLFELEHRVIRADGTVGWTLSRAIPLLDARGEIVEWFGAAQDVTTRRSVEEALRASLQETEQARAEAEAAVQAKDQFLAVLSHELRTPLTPVTMAAHTLSRRRDLPEAAREAVAMIQRNVQTETQMIDSLLDVTRVAHGKLEIARAPLDLHEAVRRAVEISSGDMQGKKQRFTLALEAGEHTLEGDANRLQQVFWNLLKNASKFTPEDGSIRLGSRNEPGRIVVEIADTGIGFEAAAATRIFEAFAQADADITRRFGGLGLGLAISKATVDAHGGTLTAHSDGPGRGAVFTVTLPIR